VDQLVLRISLSARTSKMLIRSFIYLLTHSCLRRPRVNTTDFLELGATPEHASASIYEMRVKTSIYKRACIRRSHVNA